MLDYNTDTRFQAVRDQADRLASDMRRSRPPGHDETGHAGLARLGSALAARADRLRRRRHAPAYGA
ncbi:MAG TPA: hypothetical protein VFK62_06835 [Gaiellaceae bacterium]|nr:hypothetical protein [Gaiellaceae bacterium]